MTFGFKFVKTLIAIFIGLFSASVYAALPHYSPEGTLIIPTIPKDCELRIYKSLPPNIKETWKIPNNGDVSNTFKSFGIVLPKGGFIFFDHLQHFFVVAATKDQFPQIDVFLLQCNTAEQGAAANP